MEHEQAEAATPTTVTQRRKPASPAVASIEIIPTRVRWALLLCLVWHGGLLVTGSFEDTYDAWTHIFLGDHYRRDWFSTWDQRWYTGFTTISYPPGSHMAIAAVSQLIGSLRNAFVVVQVAALMMLTVGVFRFSRLWVDERAASNAALLLVASSAIAETVHLFGQLPTTLSLGLLLNALPFVHRWVFRGSRVDLVVAVFLIGATTAVHHVTTLFGSVFFVGPVLIQGLVERSRDPIDDEPDAGHPRLTAGLLLPLTARRIRRVTTPLARIASLVLLLIGALVIVVLPYWFWSATDPIVQIPIPHGSRANFLDEPNLGLIFFVVPWGLMLLALPYALVRGIRDRKWPLAAAIGLLALLGTGGTTPLPKLLLGPAFDVLTLDRFTFWGTVMVLPLAGQLVVSFEHGAAASLIRRCGGRSVLAAVQLGFVVSMVMASLFAATLTQYRPFQPDAIDPGPIIDFLERDQHDRWRFLTLGFGDQMAWISAQTTATQVDGNYHSVRRLPELTSTSVERLEGAKYRGIDGLGSLQQFLEVPERYHLKFVFSNDEFYDPLLFFSGWQRLGRLENGVVTWERADVGPLPAHLPVREIPLYQRLMWGTIPPMMLLIGGTLIVWSELGRPGWRRGLDVGVGDRRIRWGPVRLVDGVLTHVAAQLPLSARLRPRRRRRLLAIRGALRPRLAVARISNRRRSRLTGRLLVLVVVVAATSIWLNGQPEPVDPTTVVEGYYDHLDFRRWREAYELLDPATRSDYDLWRLRMTVDGGLVASYAKLDSIATERASSELGPDGIPTTSVRADLRYLTALDWHPVTEAVQLIQRKGDWRIVQPDPDLTVPPDQLVRRAGVDYQIQGRRRVLAAVTELTDVLDRPELWISHANLVLDEGRPVIVGEVVNLDVDPADVTVTGVLKNGDDEVVLRYNATQQLIHRLMPRESTPFRIDFQEVAAGIDLEFDPLDFNPAQFDSESMVSAEVYAKAVVTNDGLHRGVSVSRVEIIGDDDVQLVGELRNDAVDEATIPMVLVTFLDQEQRVLWVESYFVDSAIRSQRNQPFSFGLPVRRLRELEWAPVSVDRYSNGIVSADNTSLSPPPLLDEVPPNLPFASVRVDVVSFTGART